MPQLIDTLTSNSLTGVLDQIEPNFKNAPHLPKGIVDFFVTVAPWLAGLGGILTIFSGLGLLTSGVGMNSSYLGLVTVSPLYFIITGVLELISGAILLLAFSPLKNRDIRGWKLMFVNMMVSVAISVVGIAFTGAAGVASLIGMAIGLAIGLYILFEMKPAYK